MSFTDVHVAPFGERRGHVTMRGTHARRNERDEPDTNPLAGASPTRLRCIASNAGLGDEFGSRVALSADGSVLAASAIAESSAATGIGGNQADDSKSSSGAAYVFGRAGPRWSQLAYVKASNTDAGDGFGTDLALSADAGILAVSANGESSAATGVDGNQASNAAQFSGAAYVFR